MSNSSTIDVGDLSATVNKILDKYGDNVRKATGELIKKAAKEAKDDVKNGAPVRTGRYKKSWSVKIEEGSAGLYTIARVHNRDRYQIAHLLEKGHAKRGGGRVPGRAHIKPAEEAAVEKVQEGVEEIAQKGE